MTQPAVIFLQRIEQLLSTGKQEEARRLLGEFINLNPGNAHAWWLMSLTVTDVNQQMDCLQRALLLDPENKPARERLAKLVSQPPVSPSVGPFTALEPAGTEESKVDGLLGPAWAAPSQADPGTEPQQSEAKQTANPSPPAPVEPAEVPHPRKSKTRWGVVLVLLSVFAILVIASFAEYLSLKRMAQAQAEAQGLLATSAVAQTLTNLPLPTLIPTWTATATFTALPSATLSETPTLTPTLKYTLTKTPRPSSLIGPVVGLYAPDFSLTDLVTGEQVSLSQFDGQPVLLFFWATWCSKCNNEIDSIATVTQTYKNAGLVVLSINTAEDPRVVSAYQIAHLLTFPMLLDPDSVVQSAYFVDLDAIPRHFFVNSSGRIASIGKGEMTLNEMKVQVDAIMRRYPTTTP